MFALSVVALYTEGEICIAIETFVSKMNRPVKLSSHHESTWPLVMPVYIVFVCPPVHVYVQSDR